MHDISCASRFAAMTAMACHSLRTQVLSVDAGAVAISHGSRQAAGASSHLWQHILFGVSRQPTLLQ